MNDQTKGDIKIIVDGFIYIGQVLNNTIITNTFHGKGKLYYPNNTLKYEEWMEDLKEMESIYFLMEIIILVNIKVQCKMVKVYYKNGIKYEGDFKNNVPDGNGKYIGRMGVIILVNG